MDLQENQPAVGAPPQKAIVARAENAVGRVDHVVAMTLEVVAT